MIIPDANLLIYAYDSECRFHPGAKRWLGELMEGDDRVGLCGPVVFAFIRLSTNPKLFRHPLSVEEAAERVRSWMDVPVTTWEDTKISDLETALGYLEEIGVGSGLAIDAKIAAIARRRAAVIHTADTDFRRFRGVRAINPLMRA